ncbi:MAG: response regulator, partial [Clostridiales bacterium]|nr:response regulator [Clostridiales bacterium]
MDLKKVLIIEDEKSISDIVKFNLVKEGFDVDTAFDGLAGLNKALETNPDLILLDIMLPSMDGFAVCKKIRETSMVPIIMLTAKEEEVDKVLGLELGADDYITKPFGMRELVARIKANIRRTEVV